MYDSWVNRGGRVLRKKLKMLLWRGEKDIHSFAVVCTDRKSSYQCHVNRSTAVLPYAYRNSFLPPPALFLSQPSLSPARQVLQPNLWA